MISSIWYSNCFYIIGAVEINYSTSILLTQQPNLLPSGMLGLVGLRRKLKK